VGRQSGLYPPSTQTAYEYKENKSPLEIFREELWKEKARIAARSNRNPQF